MKRLFVLSVFLAGTISGACGAQDAPRPHSPNPKANALFTKGLELYKKSDPRTGGTFENARAAVDLFQQAVKADPKFALAYVDMARAYLNLGYSNPGAASDSEIGPKVHAALGRAVAADPNLAEAHRVTAAVAYNMDFDWQTAGREYKRSLELEPDNATTHLSYADFLGTMGRFPEALAEADKAEMIGHSPMTDFVQARIYYDMHRYDIAIAYCEKSLAQQDNQATRFYLALMYAAQGQYDKAMPQFQRTTEEHNGGALAGLAYAYAMAGEPEKAQELLSKLYANRNEGAIVPYRMAAVYLALGERKQALQWLRLSRESHENWMAQLKVDPVMDPLRSDPAFQGLVREMHFS
ncbi:MAG TPA: tetratricopeptide repeat protein [Rhizomicrobium sp.]